MAGVPAFLNPKVRMESLMNCHVNLTARSICREHDPERILDVQVRTQEGLIPLTST